MGGRMNLNQLADKIHCANREKGFYQDAPINNAADAYAFMMRQLCLVHSEVSEAVEELRAKEVNSELERVVYWEEAEKPCGFPVEMADVLIRTLDLMAYCNIDIDAVVELKLAHNRSREQKHGKAF
jgi:hypothetical protein